MAIWAFVPCALGFEGRITTTMTRGGDSQTLLYTIGTNSLRIECLETDYPYPRDIIDLTSGQLTLLFPHNRSFVRLTATTDDGTAPSTPTGFPPGGVPPMPPTAPPGGMPPQIGPTNLPGAPDMPAMPPRPNMPQMPPPLNIPAGPGPGAPGMGMPMMPPMPMEQAGLKVMNDTTNILGYPCAHYEIQQRGEVMEIWATDKLLPFQPWLRNQPHRFGPRMIEEQWGGLLKAKKLFPLLAVLRLQMPSTPGHAAPPPGPVRMRFEVKAITPDKITDDTLFQPPPGYQEIQPLPF